MTGANDREGTPRALKCGKRRATRHGDNARQDREPRPDYLRRNGRKNGSGVPCPGGLANPYHTGRSDALISQPRQDRGGLGGKLSTRQKEARSAFAVHLTGAAKWPRHNIGRPRKSSHTRKRGRPRREVGRGFSTLTTSRNAADLRRRFDLQKIYMYKYAERGAICGRRSFVRHARRGHAAREQIDGSRRLFDARRNAHRPQMRRRMPRSGRRFQIRITKRKNYLTCGVIVCIFVYVGAVPRPQNKRLVYMLDKRYIFIDNSRRFIIEYGIFINNSFDKRVFTEYLCSFDEWEEQKNEIFNYLEYKEKRLNDINEDQNIYFDIKLFAIYKRMGE